MLNREQLAEELGVTTKTVIVNVSKGLIPPPDNWYYLRNGHAKAMYWKRETVEKLKLTYRAYLNKRVKDERKKIIKKYDSGRTLISLAREYSVSENKIRSIMPKSRIRSIKTKLPPEYIHPVGWNRANKAFNKAMRTT